MNRPAWSLLGLLFPLIVVGGLVNAYGLGTVAADWPNTFGHWMLPPHGRLGKLDGVFWYQGHRLLAYTATLWAMGVAVLWWRSRASQAVRWLGLATVLGLVVQLGLGEWPALSQQTWIAQIHAAMAPVLLSLCMATVATASRRWSKGKPAHPHEHARGLYRWCLATLALACLLTFVNVQLRHMPFHGGLAWFPFWIWSEILVGILALAALSTLLGLATRRFADCPVLLQRVAWFAGVLVVQLLLGIAAWLTQFGWPPWFTDYIWGWPYTVVAEGPLQTAIVTAHVVAGSLAPALGLNAAVWARRLVRELQE